MSIPPSPLDAAQAQCRRGALGVFTGLKLLGAGVFLPLRRRTKVELGLSGVGLVTYGALAWWSGRQTQKELRRPGSSQEIKPKPGQPPASFRDPSDNHSDD